MEESVVDVLLFGAGGMLALDVEDELRSRGLSYVPVKEHQCDIRSLDACRSVVALARPKVVLNCAAYTNVDAAERERELALAVNGDGARNVASAASEHGARCLYISTDYVFDGTKDSAYVESDTPNPLNAYGASKLEGEKQTLKACPNALVVRTSWLYGTRGRNFVNTMLRLASEGKSPRVVADQFGAPTYARDLASALVTLAFTDLSGIVHITNSGVCSWFEFAQAIFTEFGCDPENVSPISASEYAAAAVRPSNSRLANTRIDALAMRPLPSWRNALHRYLAELN